MRFAKIFDTIQQSPAQHATILKSTYKKERKFTGNKTSLRQEVAIYCTTA
jgi:hypothetical protein